MRENFSPTHKYDNPFTAYLDEEVVGISCQDDETGDIESSFGSVVRVGRYILTYSTVGFVDRETFWNVAGAIEAFKGISDAYDEASADDEDDEA